ncbi:MAG TPA: hypothetical protein IAC70_01935 [Candidatus Faecicola pullistercoris]|nr:hypothetical protein [Candidatus Faecicola pullistercoris]
MKSTEKDCLKSRNAPTVIRAVDTDTASEAEIYEADILRSADGRAAILRESISGMPEQENAARVKNTDRQI